MSRWAELKRRNVFKVGAAYLVLAWLLVQVVSSLDDPLSLPDWLDTVVVVLLAVGFPVALLLGWARELPPQTEARAEPAAPSMQSLKATGDKLNAVIIALLVVAVGFLIVDNYFLERGDGRSADRSIEIVPESAVDSAGATLANSVAVLPFANLSPNPDDAYYTEGIHAEVIGQLMKLSSLTVIARESVMRYANDRPPLDQIARELRVQYLMSGSARYQTGELRLEVSLIDPSTGFPLWGEIYQDDFSARGVFATQADIAMNLATTINARVSALELASIERVPTESDQAYAYYLNATELGGRFRFSDAITQLDLAVESDPNFAEAYAQRAYLYAYAQISSNARFQWLEASGGSGDDFAELALENAFNALELYPELGTPWVARALTHKFHFRLTEARRAFEQAYMLSPNDLSVLQEYAAFQLDTGDIESSLELIERALDRDPNGSLTLLYATDVMAAAGRQADARNLARRAVEVDPSNPLTNLYGALYTTDQAAQRQYVDAAQAFMTYPMLAPALATLNRALGDNRAADQLLAEWASWAEEIGVGAGDWAQYYASVGDLDAAHAKLLEAVESLENGELDLGYIALMRFRGAPMLPPWEEPRFRELLERLQALE